MAETLPGVTRVVLELGNGVDVTAAQLDNPARLIVELRHELKLTPPSALITEAPAIRAEPETSVLPAAIMPVARTAFRRHHLSHRI